MTPKAPAVRFVLDRMIWIALSLVMLLTLVEQQSDKAIPRMNSTMLCHANPHELAALCGVIAVVFALCVESPVCVSGVRCCILLRWLFG